MKIIVGLGNPGDRYKNTRHNAGFMALDSISAHPEINPAGEISNFSLDKRLKSNLINSSHKGEKVILAKPETFMNASGIAVGKIMQYYKADISELIVICDDVDVPLGEVKIRLCGGSAGQKGLQSIIDELGTDQFCRIRIGINNTPENSSEHDQWPSNIDTADFVLQNFTDVEMKVVNEASMMISEHIIQFIGSKEPIQATTLHSN